jgi:hypothetical protein
MTKKGTWRPGESGNPKGKPPGSGEVQKLRTAIAAHIPEIIERLVTAAKSGDIQAARLLLERVLPPVKAIEQAEPVNLPPGTLTEQGRAVMDAVAAGELSPTQAAALLGALGTLARVTELDELERRLRALEETKDA